MKKILLLAHGKNYGIPHLPTVILDTIDFDTDSIYTVDISENAKPTQILDLCTNNKINVNNQYFDFGLFLEQNKKI